VPVGTLNLNLELLPKMADTLTSDAELSSQVPPRITPQAHPHAKNLVSGTPLRRLPRRAPSALMVTPRLLLMVTPRVSHAAFSSATRLGPTGRMQSLGHTTAGALARLSCCCRLSSLAHLSS
jgi:hypothetical protein